MRQEVAKPSASRRFWRLVVWALLLRATPCHMLPTILTSLFTSLFTSPPKANLRGGERTEGLEPRQAIKKSFESPCPRLCRPMCGRFLFSIAVNRLAKVIVGDLVVVRVGNLDRVTQPCSHHVSRESLSNQFGRTT